MTVPALDALAGGIGMLVGLTPQNENIDELAHQMLATVADLDALVQAAPHHDCRLHVNRESGRVYCPVCDALARVTGEAR